MKSFVNSMGLGGLYKNKSILNFRTIDDNFSLFCILNFRMSSHDQMIHLASFVMFRVLNFRMSCRGGRFLNFRRPEGQLLHDLYSKV